MTATRASRMSRRAPAPLAAALALAASLAACARATTTATSAPVASRVITGEGLLNAMQSRYAGKWYRTLAFRQRTTQIPPQGGPERVDTWYKTLLVPGRLRIDTDLGRGIGQLFANDSQYVVLNNTLRRAAAGYDLGLVFGSDIYAQPAARSVAVLRSLGFPMGPVREGTWQERPVWIVGGAPNDLRSAQLWVDRERLLVVRLLQPYPTDSSHTFEVRFGEFEPAAGGWVATQVEWLIDGRRNRLEEYSEIRVDPKVDERLFDPRQWGTATHWAKGR